MQEAIEIKSGSSTLRGMLHIPDQITGKVPVIIIFHGFGGNKMGPHFMFVRFSRILADSGFASVRFDFAGSGESDGEFINMTLSGELEDAKSILNYVKNLEFVDRDNIGVVGFSMGGAVASMLAGLYSEDVKSLCLWAPAGNMAEIVTSDFIGDGYKEFLKNGSYEFEGLTFGKAFVDDISNIDIYAAASNYTGKVLLVHGDTDEVVSINASYRYLDYYGEKARLAIVKGTDHLFSKQSWKQQVVRHSTDFFIRELKNRG